MQIVNVIKGALGLAALAGAGMLTGCSSCEPVREEITTTTTGDCGAPVVREVTEPVGESCGAESLRINTPCDRYFDPLMQSWERPWPYGPFGTANWR